MPNFNILKTHTTENSFRVQSVRDLFSLNKLEVAETFEGCIPIEDTDWNIGVIVGGSGTGKTTIARECFGKNLISSFAYIKNSVIEDMPGEYSATEIGEVFTSVGFASPHSWLKSYAILSTGEKMRVDLARAMLESGEFFVFDEFTSVVDRQIAKTGAMAIAKAVRRRGNKFIAITCHYDVLEYLQPDWIYDTNEKKFFFPHLSDQNSNSMCMKIHMIKSRYGSSLASIII